MHLDNKKFSKVIILLFLDILFDCNPEISRPGVKFLDSIEQILLLYTMQGNVVQIIRRYEESGTVDHVLDVLRTASALRSHI